MRAAGFAAILLESIWHYQGSHNYSQPARFPTAESPSSFSESLNTALFRVSNTEGSSVRRGRLTLNHSARLPIKFEEICYFSLYD
jgi:hypothetical protein